MLWILHIKKIFTPAAFNDNDDDNDSRERVHQQRLLGVLYSGAY